MRSRLRLSTRTRLAAAHSASSVGRPPSSALPPWRWDHATEALPLPHVATTPHGTLDKAAWLTTKQGSLRVELFKHAQVGVDLMLEACQQELRQKSVGLCDTFVALVQQECSG